MTKSNLKNISEQGGKSERTRKHKLMICKVCGTPITCLINNGNYLCTSCFKEQQSEYRKKHSEQIREYAKTHINYEKTREYRKNRREQVSKLYDGLYLYSIVNKDTNKIVYVGKSTNIYNRHEKHYCSSNGTAFARYRTKNGLSRELFEMYVLDITPYKDILQNGDLDLLEHYAIAINMDRQRQKNDIVLLNDQLLEFDFLEDEISRIKTLHKSINMKKFKPYAEVIEAKKYLSTANR